jgi:hypothetical protein
MEDIFRSIPMSIAFIAIIVMAISILAWAVLKAFTDKVRAINFFNGIAKISFGIIFCALATLSIESGKTLAVGKHFGIIERVDYPFFFWLIVALYVSVALFMVWEGVKLFTQPTLSPIVASLPYPPISKPVTFLGLAFIGAIWGGIASEMLGSIIGGVLALFASVALVGAWYAVILNRMKQLSSLLFVLFSLLSGFGCIYALSLFRA